MQLDLVDCWDDRRCRAQFLDVGLREVADADCANRAVCQKLFQSSIRLDHRLELIMQWPVQQIEVDGIEPELAQGAVARIAHRIFVTIFADPELGRDEQIGALNAAFGDRLADFPLIAIDGSCIDQALAFGQCGLDGSNGVLRCGLEHAEAKRRHVHAVVETQAGMDVHGHGFSSRDMKM